MKTKLPKKKTEAEILFKTVIQKNYCIGCGNCSLVENSPFKMTWTKYGMLEPTKTNSLKNNHTKLLELCPFSEMSKNETEIANIIFSNMPHYNVKIGKYLACYAGYVTEGEYRQKGTSGGFIKWIACQLLNKREIDYFVQVSRVEEHNLNNKVLFKYKIFSNPQDVLKSESKSAYYPTSLNEVLTFIKKTKGNFALTALPCFVKSLRLITNNDDILNQKIKYVIGLICGSMKSAHYAYSIAWQQGINPVDLEKIDFREKITSQPAYVQGNRVYSKQNKESKCLTNTQLFGTDYGMGFFKPMACDYCDDIVAELADISVGDAWLPEYDKDWKGTSILITRNTLIDNLIRQASYEKKLSLNKIDVEKVIEAQGGSYRHRHDGLQYRLYKQKRQGNWTPTKRLEPEINHLTKKKKKIFDLRQKISQKSHKFFYKALIKDDFLYFYNKMLPMVKKYNALYYQSKPTITYKTRIKLLLKKFGLYS